MSSGPTRTVERDVQSSTQAATARLVFVHPPERETAIDLRLGATTIGREAADGVAVVPHAAVPRRHLLIERTGAAVVVSDQGSHNGTWRGGVRLRGAPTPLGHGDVLRLGDVSGVVEIAGDGDAPHTRLPDWSLPPPPRYPRTAADVA
ncbi:MAG: FHA domain-containing protein [Nannocystales bacterium]